MMLENAAAAFSMVAQWSSVAVLLIGVTVGVFAGAIPGMSATMAVAIALPFTFTLDPVQGILLLLGVYKGGIFGGSIPAILIKTPGTAASSATVLDGYPLAEQGKSGQALQMALYASCIADLISNLALILFAAWLASFALKFGPPEFFTLILFSLTIIAGVSGQSLTKGLIAGALGLLLATVGLDLIYGTDRFIFGNPDMMGGLNFIGVLIGLFALPEVIAFAVDGGKDRHGAVRGLGNHRLPFSELRRCLKSIVRGGIIGSVLGSIPGIGAAPSAFLSYSEARRTSPNKENFGKGELEGVAAAEAGNNGVCGATLIPLLALGIPGDVITAIIIGAFMIHGLQPGPMMFATNGDMIYALFMGLLLSAVFLFFVGGACIRLFRFIADIPKSVLLPAVLVLCVYGVYAVNNSVFDVLVMFVMGWVGYGMMRLNFPAAPFLIAFILGPLLEDNFRQAMLMGQGNLAILVRSPITWVFWTLTAFTVVVLVRNGLRARKERVEARRKDAGMVEAS